jgi:hypothetical protein
VKPCIIGTSTDYYNIKAGNCMLALKPTISFKKAVEIRFSSFWLFGIKYPEKLAKTCQFIEKVLLYKGGKPSAVVRKWANRLL